MSTYDTHLPRAFPYRLVVPDEIADRVVKLLMKRTPAYLHGSSFAVTADLYRPELRAIWLSRASSQRLKDSELAAVELDIVEEQP